MWRVLGHFGRTLAKHIGLTIARISGVKALWDEIGAEATLLLSARWLVVSTTGWVWYTECVTGWPDEVAITVASDALGAILGTVAVGTLSMEVTIVLVKLIMDGKRERNQKKIEQAEERADQAEQEAKRAQKNISTLMELLDKHDIEIPPGLTTPAEPAESTG